MGGGKWSLRMCGRNNLFQNGICSRYAKCFFLHEEVVDAQVQKKEWWKTIPIQPAATLKDLWVQQFVEELQNAWWEPRPQGGGWMQELLKSRQSKNEIGTIAIVFPYISFFSFWCWMVTDSPTGLMIWRCNSQVLQSLGGCGLHHSPTNPSSHWSVT